MKIFSNLSQVLLDIDVDDNSYRYRSIMGDHKVVLHFSMAESIEIPVGSYIQYQGQTYTLFRPENFKKNGTRQFEYEITFGSNQELLRQFKFKYLLTEPYKLKFPLTAKPEMFLDLLVQNLNLNDSGWTVGSFIEASERAISFNHDDCFSVLNRIADEFDTEWEITGKTIHLRKVEHNKDNPLVLSYGKGNGFKTGVGRTMQGDVRPVTMLYVQGGDRNIDRKTYYDDKYKSETLLLPMEKTLSYEGRTYKTDKHGMFITRADKPLTVVSEDSYDGSDFYPSRIGTVSTVETEEGSDDEGEPVTFYNIIDKDIPDDLDFSKCTVEGEKVTIIFQSGKLTGKEFEVFTDEKGNLIGYEDDEKRFKLVSANMDGVLMPNVNYCPQPGDKYAVFHISLPRHYICDDNTQTGASWDMFKEAVRYMYENEEEKFSFTGELDSIWSKKNWLSIGAKLIPGSYILFSDPQFQPEGIPIRITGITDNINKPYSPTIELSNAPVAGYLSTELGKIKGEEVVNEERIVQLRSYTKRRYEDAKEAQTMLEKALDNFSPGVDPIWVRTMSVLVGNEYQQFEFVTNKTESQKEVIPDFKMDNTAKIFTTPTSILKHMTMGIENTSSTHDAKDYKYWDVAGNTSPYLGDMKSAFYLVAKCVKSGTSGEFMLVPDGEYTYDPGDGNYYFLVGLLSTEREGERSYANAYGYTEILPGQMRIKNIISPDGKTSFNVAEGIISGNIQIQAGSTGYKNLDDTPDLTEFTTTSDLKVLNDRITANVEQVTTINGRVTTIERAGYITTAQGNSWYANKQMEDGSYIVSRINQTPSTVTIAANKINLQGVVTYSMLNTSLKNELDAKLESGEITLNDFNTSLRTYITNMSTDIASKVNSSALKAFAKNGGPGVSKTDFINDLQTEFNGKLTGSATTSGNKLANVIVNGQTLILGGYIQAQYINVDNLTVNNVAQVGNWKISNGQMIWKDNPTSVYGNPVGTWLSAEGSMRLLSPNRSSFVLFSAKDDGYMLSDMRRDTSGIFLHCTFSSSGSYRLFSVSSLIGAGDASWYNRIFIRASHLPFKVNLPNVTVTNSGGTNNYAVRWDQKTGYFYIQ